MVAVQMSGRKRCSKAGSEIKSLTPGDLFSGNATFDGFIVSTLRNGFTASSASVSKGR